MHMFIPRPCINSYHAGLDGNTQEGKRDAGESKRKDKLSLCLLCCNSNLPVSQPQPNCQLQVVKHGLCMRFSSKPSFHTVQLKWRGSYDSLILSPDQPRLSSWWVIHQRGRAGVLCVTYMHYPNVPLLPRARAMEHGIRAVWGAEVRENAACI